VLGALRDQVMWVRRAALDAMGGKIAMRADTVHDSPRRF